MPQHRKLRIAVAVYRPLSRLAPTLESLDAEGVAYEQLGLVALTSVAARLATPAAPGQGIPMALDALLANLTPLVAGTADPLVVSKSLLSSWHSGARIPALWRRVGDHHQGVPRLARSLECCAASGAAVLTVLSDSARQQWRNVSILLRGSVCPVLAVEYSLPLLGF